MIKCFNGMNFRLFSHYSRFTADFGKGQDGIFHVGFAQEERGESIGGFLKIFFVDIISRNSDGKTA